MKFSESYNPPGIHNLCIWDFSWRSSEVRSVTWPRPIISLWGILKSFIFQYTGYNTNSDTSNDKYWCHTLLLSCLSTLFYFAFLTLCDITAHVTWAFLVHQRLSSITSDQTEIEAPLCLHWAPESTNMQFDPLFQSMIWGGETWLWTQGQPWLWPLTKKKYIIRCSLMRGLRCCFNFGSTAIFG